MKDVLFKVGIGSFMYAIVGTRIDFAFAMITVSHFMSKVGPPYWMAVKRIMRYSKVTLNFNLCLRGKNIGWEMQMTNNPPQVMCFLLVLESSRGNARNNQLLHSLRWRPSRWPLAIVQREWFP